MALRGENVGTAYVRVLADGSGLDDDIRDDLADTGKVWGKQGQKDADLYNDSLRRQMRKQRPTTQKDLEETMRVRVNRIQNLTKELSSNYFKSLEREVRRGAGDSRMGDYLVRELRKSFLTGGGYDAFGSDMQRLFDNIGRWEQDFARKMASDREKRETAENKARISREKQVNDQLIKLAQDRVKRQRADRRQELADWQNMFDSIEAEGRQRVAEERRQHRDAMSSLDRLRHSYEQLSHGIRNSNETMQDSIVRTRGHVEELRKEIDKSTQVTSRDRRGYHVELDRIEGSIVRLQPRFRRLNSSLDRMAPRIGRMFGRGARNDAVNLFGVFAEGATRMLFTLPKMVEGISGFVQAFRSLPEGASMFTRLSTAVGATGGSFTALLPSIAAVAIALPVVVVAIGTLVAAMSMLLGIITALASTIYFALIGSLAAVAGAIVPVVAGIAVLAGAIASMSDAQKEAIQNAIKPFVEEMKSLGRIAAQVFADRLPSVIQTATRGIKSANFDGLVRNISNAIMNVADGWAHAIDSPNFKRFINVMSRTLPGQIEGLGRVTSNVFSGIGATIIALQPTVDRFVKWLERITGEWAEWAQSDEGQQAMLDFFDRAVESAKSLGDFLGEIGGLIHDLFTGGQDTGDNMFDSMADAVARFRDYIADGGLEKWFQDAAKFASALGTALEGIGALFDALDTTLTRFVASGALGQLGGALSLIAFSLEATSKMFELLWLGITKIPEAVTWALEGLGRLGSFLGGLAEQMVLGFINGLASLGSLIGNLAEQMVLWVVNGLAGLGTAVWNAITGAFNMLTGFLGTLGSGIVSAISSGISGAAGLARSAAETVGNGISSAFNATRDAASRFGSFLRSNLSSALESARSAGGRVANFFSSNVKRGWDNARSGAKNLADYAKGAFSSAIGAARSAGSRVASFFRGTFNSAMSGARNILNAIGDAASWLRDRLSALIGMARDAARALSNIKMPNLGGFSIGGAISSLFTASGGVFDGAQHRIIGEAGPEAVVPLNRPLAQVDPAVRELSAIAQGKSLGSTDNSRRTSVDFSGMQIITPTRNPAAVAREVMDEVVGALT